jgi:hypothetical protein
MSKSTRLGVNTRLGNNDNTSDNKNFVLGSVGARNRSNRKMLINRVRPDCPCFDLDNYPVVERGITLRSLYIQDDTTFDSNNIDSFVIQGGSDVTVFNTTPPYNVKYGPMRTLYYLDDSEATYVEDISFTPLHVVTNDNHPVRHKRTAFGITTDGISTIVTDTISGPGNPSINANSKILTINGKIAYKYSEDTSSSYSAETGLDVDRDGVARKYLPFSGKTDEGDFIEPQPEPEPEAEPEPEPEAEPEPEPEAEPEPEPEAEPEPEPEPEAEPEPEPEAEPEPEGDLQIDIVSSTVLSQDLGSGYPDDYTMNKLYLRVQDLRAEQEDPINLTSLKLTVNPTGPDDPIFQEPLMNSAVTPTQNEINLAPLRIYDTYVAWGEEIAASDQDRPNFQGGVIDRDNLSDIVWFKAPTPLPVDGFIVSQITLKSTSNGNWIFSLNPEGVQNVPKGTITGSITNGVMNVTNITYSFNNSQIQ